MRPAAVEFQVEKEVALRGLRWTGGPLRVVLVHAPGDDLDAWGDLPRRLARSGFDAWAMDQRGHGLSDGEAGPEQRVSDLAAVCGDLGRYGPIGLVTAGQTAGAALRLGRDDRVFAHVMLSPQGLPDTRDGWRDLPAHVARLVLVGGLDGEARAAAERLFRNVPGGAAWGVVPVVEQGTAMLRSRLASSVSEDIRLFLRRHLPVPRGESHG